MKTKKKTKDTGTMSALMETLRVYKSHEDRINSLEQEIESLRGMCNELIAEKLTRQYADGVDDSKEETPKIGEKYSCLRSDGSTNYFLWQDTLYDRARWSVGNCKRIAVDDSEEFTREELKEIRQLAEKEGDKCYKINYTVVLKDLYDGIYFKANKMLKEK